MKNNSTLFVFVLVLTFLSGCSATSYKPQITSDVKARIKSIKVVSLVPQEEIDVQFYPSNAGATGGMQAGAIGALIGAAIDSAIEHSRAVESEGRAEKYRGYLTNFDFRSRVTEMAGDDLKKIDWASVSSVEDDVAFENFKVQDYLQSLEEDALLVLETHYSLSPDLTMINVDTHAFLYAKSGSQVKQKKVTPLAKRYIQYQTTRRFDRERVRTEEEIKAETEQLENYYKEKIASAPQYRKMYEKEHKKKLRKLKLETVKVDALPEQDWNQDSLQQSLVAGVDHIGHILLIDLNDSRSAEDYQKVDTQIPIIYPMGPNAQLQAVNGYLLGTFNGNNIYRLLSGDIYSAPEGEPVRQKSMMQ